ncbi:hypothetical protein MXB_4052, partial [Myxobolus squamalis]
KVSQPYDIIVIFDNPIQLNIEYFDFTTKLAEKLKIGSSLLIISNLIYNSEAVQEELQLSVLKIGQDFDFVIFIFLNVESN